MKKLMKKIKDTLNIFHLSKGFTLLELLVVVLIIGILAAVALPQYQNAVRKARVAEAKLTLRVIGDAIDRYFLQNNVETQEIEDLDIDISNESNNWDFAIDECLEGGCNIIAEPKWEDGYDIRYYSSLYGDSDFAGKITCASINAKGSKICQQLGGVLFAYDEYMI